MLEPRRVELSVTGIVNGKEFSGRGTLQIGNPDGVKSGQVTFDSSPPPPGGPTVVGTFRCFIGARHVGREPFLGPLELLGRDFSSIRSTTTARSGSVSLCDRARMVGDVLRSELAVAGEIRVPVIRSIGPLREVITVSGDGTLASEGRYSYLAARRRPILVRYTHFYRSLRPDRRLFRRLRGQRYLLQANIWFQVRGRTVKYRSQSTLRRLRDS